MEEINEDIIIDIDRLINISPEILDNKINNVQLLAIKKRINIYKEIYRYSVEYIQNNDNENVIDIDRGTTIYDYYKGFYNNYKIYDN